MSQSLSKMWTYLIFSTKKSDNTGEPRFKRVQFESESSEP